MSQPLWNLKKKVLLFVEPMVQRQPAKANLTTQINTALTAHGNNRFGNRDMNDDVRRLCQEGLLKEALDVLNVMNRLYIRPHCSTYASLLQECSNKKALAEGKLVHAHLIGNGFSADILLGNKLVIMYAKCGSLVDARRVLEEIPERNVVSWTATIAASVRCGCNEEALALYYQMQRTGIKPNHFTFASVLPACANLMALERGKEVHGNITRSGVQSDIFVASALVDMYAKCGSVIDARDVFDKMSERNVVSWNAMIAGYTQNRQVDEALNLFQKMPERNAVSWNTMITGFVQNEHFNGALKIFGQMQLTGMEPVSVNLTSVLPACANLAALNKGKEVHEHIIKCGFQPDIFVESAVIDMYTKCGNMKDALKVFDRMLERDVVSWNTMVAGYAQHGCDDEALKLFQKMPQRDMVSWTSIIAGYAQNGHVDKALKLFRKMPEQNTVLWNTMIAGYAQNDSSDESLDLFREMQLRGVQPVSVTFTSILPVCANLAALKNGKETHAKIIRSAFESDIFVGSALVDMYAKCGSIEDASQVFDKMPEGDVVSWTVMIAGYAMHGCGKEALHLFEQMQQSGIKPDHVTFIGILSACCHAGLVDDGCQYFYRMSQDFQITPAVEHYSCMVDLLGRAGRLDEAQNFINKMPIEPNAAVWGSLLGACRIHTNIELGERVAERLFELEPKNAANYLLLSNIYAATGRWDDIENIRKMWKDRRIEKSPGCSWIEINNKVYSFLVRDRSNPEADRIFAELERLSGQMEEAGYVPDVSLVLHDVEEE